jgi:hypothetical protein
MRKSVRIVLAGIAGGVALTVVPIVNPFISAPSTEDTRPVGVGQTLPTEGTAPVVTPSPVKSFESASKSPAERERSETRESASPTPSESSSAPNGASREKRTTTERVTYISGYTYCGASASEAQPCIDKGGLVLYYPAGVTTLGGHDYKGWYWMDDLPVGRQVVISSGKLAGTYRVYDNGFSSNKMFPENGKGADIALQTCVNGNEGIGFSFLRRV